MSALSSQEPDRVPEVDLTPRLGLLSVTAFGVSYMAPSLVMVIFGIVAAASAGTAPTAFLLATAAMLLTGLSYARMARIYPTSGSAYAYARRIMGAPLGFMIGWAVLLDYLFLPMLAWLVQSIYLNAQFPSVPVWVWMLLNAGLTSVINIVGLVLTDRINRALTALAIFLVLLFVGVCLVHLGSHHPTSFTAPFWNGDSTLAMLPIAASIAAYSFLGFDAVTTLSEETRDPARTIPRAVLLVIATGGVLFVGVSYVMQLVHPGGVFDVPDIASYTMSIQVGGQSFADWTNLAAIVAGFASGLAVQLSSSRLLYIMGRDGVLPRTVFGALHPRWKTPVWCIVLTGATCLLGLRLDLATATSFINFGAFLAFTAVNLCVIGYYLRHRTARRLSPVTYVALPAVGACVTTYLLWHLSHTAVGIGLVWLACGAAYLAWLTRGFRRQVPQMHLEYAATPVLDRA